jgi:hypothetical protein
MTVHGYPPDAIIVVHQEAPDAAVAIRIRMDIDEDEMPEHHADSRMRLPRAAGRRTPARRLSPRPGSAAHASAYTIALYVYYPIALHQFYLIVSREDWSRPLGSAAPHPVADKLISLFLRQVD